MVKFSKFCSESLHGDTDRRCCVQMSKHLYDGKSVKSWRYLPDKKLTNFGSLKLSLRRGSPPKFRFHPNRFTSGGDIAECMNTVFCTVEYFYYRLFEPIMTSNI